MEILLTILNINLMNFGILALTNEWINEYKQSFEYQTLQKYLITLLFKIQILKSLMNQNL